MPPVLCTDELIQDWDGELCCVRRDPVTGTLFIVAIDSTERGPAAGGTRAMTYASPSAAVADAMRLAEAMTLKMAVAGLPMGGGKSVIALPAPREQIDAADWDRILDLHAANLRLLGGNYWTGPDVGTSPADMDRLHAAGGHAFGRSEAAGGPGSSAGPTALGVLAAIRSAATEAGMSSLRDVHVVVQGLGAVGMRLVELLVEDGARVTAADIVPDRGAHAVHLGAQIVTAATVTDIDCDVFSPCATGGVIDETLARTISCRVVAGAANNIFADEVAPQRLAERGIVVAPDFVANGGGAVHLVGREVLGWSAAEVERRCLAIGDTLTQIFAKAKAMGTTPEASARQVVIETHTDARNRGT